jgi:hypothetical protein
MDKSSPPSWLNNDAKPFSWRFQKVLGVLCAYVPVRGWRLLPIMSILNLRGQIPKIRGDAILIPKETLMFTYCIYLKVAVY